uniref:Uncharacterized protein n=1 Tax=Ascaris lumbricoides TaxID=6252 RepID=A0A0M3HIU1_ASCLU
MSWILRVVKVIRVKRHPVLLLMKKMPVVAGKFGIFLSYLI